MIELGLTALFKKRIVNTFGYTGKTWLANLPALITKCEKRFNIKISQAFEHQSLSFTARATQADGTKIVIKLCVPTSEVDNEINALEFMNGDGIVNLLNSDGENGIVLLERLTPGAMLTTVGDDLEATRIAANVMQKIGKTIERPYTFQTTALWFDRLDQPIKLPTDFPAALIDQAKKMAMALHQSMGEAVLLHGDLHHFNILSANRQPWLAIDPKGIVGEREYEIGAFLRNPIPEIATTMDTKKVLARRLDLLANILEFDRQKLCAWGFAQAVLAAVWCIDSNDESYPNFLKCAKVLNNLL